MTLTQAELEDIQADAMADDIAIDLEKMSLWTREQATTYFESGGEVEPAVAPPPFTAPFTNGTTSTGATPWLACLEKKPSATRRLVVVSWTGNRGGQGSAHNIRRAPANWSKEVGPEVEVYEVALPGRGTRVKEALFTSTPELVKEMAAQIGGALQGGPPYALVGFAFGAVLAYELGRAIAEGSGQSEGPALLIACSAEGPSWSDRRGTQHSLGESAFIDLLRRKGGTDFILQDPGLTKMYVPVIKADLTLEETYTPPATHAAFPIVALVGTLPGRDKEKSVVSAASAELWGMATSAPYRQRQLSTDWYIMQEESGVQAILEEAKTFLLAL